jgi:hypothetical protein
VLGEGDINATAVLIKNIQETQYPNETNYKDVDKKRMWFVGEPIQYNSQGILIKLHEYFAFIDKEKKVFDFTDQHDKVQIRGQLDDHNDESQMADHRKKLLIQNFFDFLPKINQATLSVVGLLRFQDIELIDEKGDTLFNIPHIYVDFKYTDTPFKRLVQILEGNDQTYIVETDAFSRISKFPKEFVRIKPGKIYRDIDWKVHGQTVSFNSMLTAQRIFDFENKYTFLNERDENKAHNRA